MFSRKSAAALLICFATFAFADESVNETAVPKDDKNTFGLIMGTARLQNLPKSILDKAKEKSITAESGLADIPKLDSENDGHSEVNNFSKRLKRHNKFRKGGRKQQKTIPKRKPLRKVGRKPLKKKLLASPRKSLTFRAKPENKLKSLINRMFHLNKLKIRGKNKAAPKLRARPKGKGKAAGKPKKKPQKVRHRHI